MVKFLHVARTADLLSRGASTDVRSSPCVRFMRAIKKGAVLKCAFECRSATACATSGGRQHVQIAA